MSAKKKNASFRPDDTLNLSDFSKLLWYRKIRLSIFVIVPIITLGCFLVAFVQPNYMASASIMLDARTQQVTEIENIFSNSEIDNVAINTEVEILKSSKILSKVVIDLKLQNDPEFNLQIQRKSKLTDSFQAIYSWISSLIDVDRRNAASTPHSTHDEIVNQLRMKTKIAKVPLSRVISISAHTTKPEKSTIIANAMAQTYLMDQLEEKQEGTQNASDWLNARVKQLRSEFLTLKQELETTKARTSVLSVQFLDRRNLQLKEIQNRLVSLQIQQDQPQLDLEALKGAGGENARNTSEIDIILQQQAQHNDGEGEAEFFDKNDTHTVSLPSDVQASMVNKSQQLQRLQNVSQILQSQIKQEGIDLIALQELEREVVAAQEIYEYFLGRFKEISIHSGFYTAGAKLISPANIPSVKASPNIGLLFSIAGLIGILSGIVAVTYAESKLSPIRNRGQLDDVGLAVLGTFSDSRKYTLDLQNEIDQARCLILHRSKELGSKFIFLNSSDRCEDLGNLSEQLATSIQKTGMKVLQVKFESRPNGQSVLGSEQETLADEITKKEGKVDRLEFYLTDFDKDIDIERALQILGREYDLILSSGSNLVRQVEALKIACASDQNIICVRLHKTSLWEVNEIKNRLKQFAKGADGALILNDT